MHIFNQVNVRLQQNKSDYLAFIEQLPQVQASGETLAEAKDNLMIELERYEKQTYSTYTIVEYKYQNASFF